MARAAKTPAKHKKPTARPKAAKKPQSSTTSRTLSKRTPAKPAPRKAGTPKASRPKSSPKPSKPVARAAKPRKGAAKAASPKAGKKAVARAPATRTPAAKAPVRKLAPVKPGRGKAVAVTPVDSRKAPKASPVESTPVDPKKVKTAEPVEIAPVDPKKPAAETKKVTVLAPKPEPEKPKKPRKPEITPRELAKIKEQLERERAEFASEARELEEAAFNLSQSEMSGEVSFDEEYADAGSFTFEREKDLSIGQNVRDMLERTEHALAAIEKGTYGICENCGEPIAKARLLALPRSTMCLKCKQQDERTR